jgi:hypothetical protein
MILFLQQPSLCGMKHWALAVRIRRVHDRTISSMWFSKCETKLAYFSRNSSVNSFLQSSLSIAFFFRPASTPQSSPTVITIAVGDNLILHYSDPVLHLLLIFSRRQMNPPSLHLVNSRHCQSRIICRQT